MMSRRPAPGDPAPDFTLRDSRERPVTLSEYRGTWVVLYFYPRDNTGGCTLEAREFSERAADFASLGATVLGVSRDTPASHRRFTVQQDLTVTLLSDPDHRVHEAYGAWGRKVLYGRESLVPLRSTFLINPGGTLAAAWFGVKPRGHAETVLETLRAVQEGVPLP